VEGRGSSGSAKFAYTLTACVAKVQNADIDLGAVPEVKMLNPSVRRKRRREFPGPNGVLLRARSDKKENRKEGKVGGVQAGCQRSIK